MGAKQDDDGALNPPPARSDYGLRPSQGQSRIQNPIIILLSSTSIMYAYKIIDTNTISNRYYYQLKRIIPHVISIPAVYKHVPIMVYELLPTQPFGKRCNEYLLHRFLIVCPQKQNRPVLFFKTHILGPQNQYTPVLFLKHIYQIFRISTCLFYFKTHILGPQNQYTPVLFFRAHILGTQNQNTPVLIFYKAYISQSRTLLYPKLCNGILCQLVN